MPFNNGHYARRFKAVLRDLELSDELRISNAWSGKITKAKALVDPKTLSHAAQHTQMRKNDPYTREQSGSANKVIELRDTGH